MAPRANNRKAQPGESDGFLALGALAAGAGIAGSIALAVRWGHQIAGTPAGPGRAEVPLNPVAVVLGLITGTITWPGAAGWAILAGFTLILLAVTVLVVWAAARLRAGSSRVDEASAYMGRGRDIESLSSAAVLESARRLGVVTLDGAPVDAQRAGVQIGQALVAAAGAAFAAHNQTLYGSHEDMHVDIWGPRTGKTTSRAVPAILNAVGPVLVTSNKRDVVDATRDPRATAGQVWVFDPQGISGESAQRWWWNPLSYVTDEVKAAKLAEHFASGSRDPSARTDAYFDPAGQDLLAALLLAAALDQRPITDVYVWLTRPTDDAAVSILHRHGYALTASQLAGVIGSPEKQRGGIYGTAMQMASCLTNRQVATWVTPGDFGGRRAHFDVAAFVRSAGTLYSLSKEGRGTAGPLVTALTVAVVEAAEELAARSAGGRLATPLLGVLDEAANVCRWRELPNLYSHFGSRGIVLMTILQSWSQGVEVWGELGMRKLWSAANVCVYGGGVSETTFLEDLSKLIGDYDRVTTSLSRGRNQRSVSRQLQRERILDVAALGALPKGRAIVLASGARPTLVRTLPWMSGPHAQAVRASIAAHDPQAERTLAEADTELAQAQARAGSGAGGLLSGRP